MYITFELGSPEHADAILEAVDGRNDLVHAAFNYFCKACGKRERIYLGCGVEGPPFLREKDLYIASPFIVQCNCGGDMAHVAWKSDQHFPLSDPPPGVRYFRIPRSGINLRNFGSSVFAGDMGP